MKENKLTILVSSYGYRLIDFLRKLPKKNEKIVYFIGHQNHQDIDIAKIKELMKNREDIFYYPLNSVGVTKSRNYLLDQCDDGIIWFCDDDINFENGFADTILNSHAKDPSTVITFIVNDDLGMPRKLLLSNKITQRTKLSILSVGTIEITIKKNESKQIRFPEDMGAGTLIPIGDEAVFLSQFLEKKLIISFHPQVICSHPRESSGSVNSSLSNYSRGVTIRRVYKLTFPIIAVIFALRRANLLKLGNSYIQGLYYFIKGIINGR